MDNHQLLAKLTEAYNTLPADRPRIGDFLALPQEPGKYDPRMPAFVRFTHCWPDQMQTSSYGENGGTYHLGEGGISFSGSLDPGIASDQIEPTQETREGRIWIWDKGIAGAGRGIDTTMQFRVFRPKAGADLSGIRAIETGLFLMHHPSPVGCGYHWSVYRHGSNHRAFREEHELTRWLASENLAIAQPAETPSQRIVWPFEAGKAA